MENITNTLVTTAIFDEEQLTLLTQQNMGQ